MNLVRYPATPCLSVEPESGGGLLLRRHKTLLTRRSVVYFCSGAHIILCFQELCDAYLMKPIDLAELVGQMKRYELIQ